MATLSATVLILVGLLVAQAGAGARSGAAVGGEGAEAQSSTASPTYPDAVVLVSGYISDTPYTT
ncbi:MAG: hypothetical protein ACR2N5_01315, partial [Solirubrobacterales bacterium]